MRSSLRYVLIVLALLAGALFVACGSDSDDNGDADDGLEGFPLPSGADEVQRLSMSGTQIPIFSPDDSIDRDRFTDITFIAYEVDMSAEDLVAFYEDNQGSWDESFSLSSSEGAFFVWTQDDGSRAVWVAISERAEDEPNLLIYQGSASE